MAGAREIGPRARRIPVEADLHSRAGEGREKRGSRPGERPRENRIQDEAVRTTRRAVAAWRDHRVELVRSHDERDPGRLRRSPRALRHRAPFQSAASDAAGRDRWGREDLGGDDSARHGILCLDGKTAGPPAQGTARACRKSSAGGPKSGGLPSRRRRRRQRRRCGHRVVLGAGPALGHHGQPASQSPRRRPRRHRALLPAVHRSYDSLVESSRTAGADARSAKETHRQRSRRGRLALHRRAGGGTGRDAARAHRAAQEGRGRHRVAMKEARARSLGAFRRARRARKRQDNEQCTARCWNTTLGSFSALGRRGFAARRRWVWRAKALSAAALSGSDGGAGALRDRRAHSTARGQAEEPRRVVGRGDRRRSRRSNGRCELPRRRRQRSTIRFPGDRHGDATELFRS